MTLSPLCKKTAFQALLVLTVTLAAFLPQTRAEEISARSEYRYQLPEQEDNARALAQAEARLLFYSKLANTLQERPDLRFMLAAQKPEDAPLMLLAIAGASTVLECATELSVTEQGTLLAAAECRFAADAEAPRLQSILGDQELLALYGKAVSYETALVETGRSQAARWQTMPAPSLESDSPPSIGQRLRAMELYWEALRSFHGIWHDPDTLYAAMGQALLLDPENALCHNAYGEAALLLGLSHEAFEAQSAAIRYDPAFARAYHARGAAQLALQLPTLAIADFNEAIRYSPRSATYRVDRGAANLLRKEFAMMCEDFYAACALGSCDAYEWAVTEKHCFPPAATEQSRRLPPLAP